MLLLVQILLIAATAFADDCPPTDKVLPCSCNQDRGIPTVNCEGVNSITEIEPAVKNTVGFNVSFAIFRSHLGDIPSDFFRGHTSVKLHFEQCVVRSFGDTPFRGLENSLETLNIYKVLDRSHTKLDKFRLSHLQKLKYVSLSENDIGELGNHWFEGGPASLEQLNLVSNKIEKVGDKVLASLVNLQQLYINTNRIKTVARSMLPNPSKHLWLLEAKLNHIEELPTDAFEGYPNLKIVNLSQNKLKSIPENVWGKVWNQLHAVYLDANNIVCDENLKWIYTRKLPNAFVGRCGTGNKLQKRALNSLKLEDFQ